MRYTILFDDLVVGHSSFEMANEFGGSAEGELEPTAAFDRVRPLLPSSGITTQAADPEMPHDPWLDLMDPAIEQLPLRVADADGRALNARVYGLGILDGRLTVMAWINDAAFWRGVAER